MKASSSEDEFTESCMEKYRSSKAATLSVPLPVSLKTSCRQKLYLSGYLIYVKTDFQAAVLHAYMQLEVVWPLVLG